MNEHPLFSVLIANYNNGRYIQEAIESVKSQTYSNWEIIIVDDGSTDNSKNIYLQISDDDRIKVFINDENKGVGYTKRKLCELANGELAGFLDADDAMVENTIESVIRVHLEDNYSLVYSNRYLCDENLQIIKESNYQIQIPEGMTYLDVSLGRISHFASFKLEYYKRTEGINPYFLMGEDQDLYFKLEEVGRIKYLDKPLYKYRQNSRSISSICNSETIVWGVFAKYEACKRRGLNPVKYVAPLIQGEHRIIRFYENSRDYKMGKLMLMPYRFFKYKLFSRK